MNRICLIAFVGVLASPAGLTAQPRDQNPALVRALSGKLADVDEDVRVEAAAALAEVGNHDGVEALLAAFERDLETSVGPEGGRLTHETARAIAKVGAADDLQRLLGFL